MGKKSSRRNKRQPLDALDLDANVLEPIPRVKDGVPPGCRQCTKCYRFYFPGNVNYHRGSAIGPACGLATLSEDEQKQQIANVKSSLVETPVDEPPRRRSLCSEMEKTAGSSPFIRASNNSSPLIKCPSESPLLDDNDDEEEVLNMENENLRLKIECQSRARTEKQKRLQQLREENEKLRSKLAQGDSNSQASPTTSPLKRSRSGKKLQDFTSEELNALSTADLKCLYADFEKRKQEEGDEDERREILTKIRDTKVCTSASGAVPRTSAQSVTTSNKSKTAASFEDSQGKGDLRQDSVGRGKKKSGATQKWDVNVSKTEPYPHQFIGSYMHQFDSSNVEWNKDNIPMPLFVSGFAKIIQQDLNISDSTPLDAAALQRIKMVRDKKLQFLCDLMYLSHSANSWDVARQMANQKILEQELSETLTWDDYQSSSDYLFLMSCVNAKSARPQPKGKDSKFGTSRPPRNDMPSYICKMWNQGTCHEPTDHVTNNVVWRHNCFSCWKKGSVKQHRESEPSCPHRQ
jgi:hypothetical protein